MGEFSIAHWLILGFILVLFWGPQKLPQLGQSLGKAIRGFKEGLNTEDAEATPVKDPVPAQNVAKQEALGQASQGQNDGAQKAAGQTMAEPVSEKKNT